MLENKLIYVLFGSALFKSKTENSLNFEFFKYFYFLDTEWLHEERHVSIILVFYGFQYFTFFFTFYKTDLPHKPQCQTKDPTF